MFIGKKRRRISLIIYKCNELLLLRFPRATGHSDDIIKSAQPRVLISDLLYTFLGSLPMFLFENIICINSDLQLTAAFLMLPRFQPMPKCINNFCQLKQLFFYLYNLINLNWSFVYTVTINAPPLALGSYSNPYSSELTEQSLIFRLSYSCEFLTII